jgi:hypothetical protein
VSDFVYGRKRAKVRYFYVDDIAITRISRQKKWYHNRAIKMIDKVIEDIEKARDMLCNKSMPTGDILAHFGVRSRKKSNKTTQLESVYGKNDDYINKCVIPI